MIRPCALALALALGLAACAPPAQDTVGVQSVPAPASVAARCTAQASHDWSAVGSQYYLVEAEGAGPSCAEATATIRLKSRDGTVLFEQAYEVAAVPLAFNPNADQTTFRADLDAWTQNVAETPTADWLPAWPSGAARPPGFQPAAGVTRARYEAARGAQGPLFCYPDGNESNACVALAGDNATLLGSLTPERL